jgi:tetratricopeptide (TPR) repeat protein
LTELYEDLMDDECPVSKPDQILTKADSLNNRGVSSMDLGQYERAKGYFMEALGVDPLHPQALFNQYAVLSDGNPYELAKAESGLLQSAKIDSYNPVQFELLVRICIFSQQKEEAYRYLKMGQERGSCASFKSLGSKLRPVLSIPSSGSSNAFNQTRFHRLICKSENAIKEGDFENARRYVMMAGDLTAYSRHPLLHQLREQISQNSDV